MHILLDTHIYLWCLQDDKERLTKKARTIICEANAVYVSSASIWEAVIKAKMGKLEVNIDDLESAITASGFIELSVSAKHAITTYQLPLYYKDPFDRILIAQSICEPLKFLTADETLLKYSDLIEIM